MIAQSLEKQNEAMETFLQRLEQSNAKPTADLQLMYNQYLGWVSSWMFLTVSHRLQKSSPRGSGWSDKAIERTKALHVRTA